jgi:hypothetical protein
MLEKFNALGTGGTQFAYYTTSEVAASILTKRQFWMRNASLMNDYSEIDHGTSCLKKAKDSGVIDLFRTALNTAFSEAGDEVLQLFDSWLPTFANGTYILSLSAHDPSDRHGQLAMWRAYGGRSGVAIIVDGSVVLSPRDLSALYASPVMYWNPDQFATYFKAVANRMIGESDYLKSFEREELKSIAFTMLRSAALCTKHPGFQEEREWRVLASPDMYPSDLLRREVENLRGTLQIVLKVNLMDSEVDGIDGLELSRIVNRLILGPCDHPKLILEALVRLLEEAGFAGARERIDVSGIPLRHW